MLNAGKLKHRITIQQGIITEGELDQQLEEWVDFKSVRCMIKTLQGREYVAASATQSERTYRFVMRYTKGINSFMRIVYDERVFNIDSVINDDEENKTLTVIAKEGDINNGAS
jgi:SPP1 family predicted phage head-tail adaptor